MDKKILIKAANYCAYQERTQNEVRERLKKWQVLGLEAEEMIAYLIEENYINEERYAKAFAGGKFRVKKWGLKKIKYSLMQKGLSEYCINAGLKEIEEDVYRENLIYVLKKAKRTTEDEFKERGRLFKLAYAKGYESTLINEVLKEII